MNVQAICFSIAFVVGCAHGASGQGAITFERTSFPVSEYGQALRLPFLGGLNAPQFWPADLNNDGLADLVVFDRVGDHLLTFINNGTQGDAVYDYAPDYARHFPLLLYYFIMRDYNADGAIDIFCASTDPGTNEMQVFRGYFEQDTLKFAPYLFDYPSCPSCDPRYVFYPSPQPGSWFNLAIANTDIPAVEDIDGDGDLDILTFDFIAGGHILWLRNMSVEKNLGPETMRFELWDDCWGRFYESGFLPCISDLSASPEVCANAINEPIAVERQKRHPGSTILAIDLDGNGLKDLLLGDVSFDCINALYNNGTNFVAWMNKQDSGFPQYDTPVKLAQFPAMFYFDADNDGLNDLIAAPNNKTFSEDRQNVWVYRNQSSPSGEKPFALHTTEFLVGDMIDVGSGAHPAIADVNGDGLPDLVVGNAGFFTSGKPDNSRLVLYLNTGTPTAPAFTLADEDWLQFSQFTNFDSEFSPTFGDLDGDGDLDLIVGGATGGLYYYVNNAGPGQAMNLVRDFNSMWWDMRRGIVAAPHIVDLDGDGKADILTGKRNGRISFYKNIGAVGAPAFEADPTILNLGNASAVPSGDFVGFATPVIVRQNGKNLLISGSQSGQLLLWDNVSASADPFTQVTQSLGGVRVGNRSHPAFADLDNDGYLEAAVGNLRGGLELFKTNLLAESSSVAPTPRSPRLALALYPNPADDAVWAQSQFSGDKRWRLYNLQGLSLASGMGGAPSFRIELGDLPPGVYVVEVVSDEGVELGRVLRR